MTLKKAEGNREVEIPGFIRQGLIRADALDAFLRQPNYMKREQINHIGAARKDETKKVRIGRLISRLADGHQGSK